MRLRIRCYFYDLRLDIPIEFPWQLFIAFQIRDILKRVAHTWATEQRQQAASNSVLKGSISHRFSRHSVICPLFNSWGKFYLPFINLWSQILNYLWTVQYLQEGKVLLQNAISFEISACKITAFFPLINQIASLPWQIFLFLVSFKIFFCNSLIWLENYLQYYVILSNV